MTARLGAGLAGAVAVSGAALVPGPFGDGGPSATDPPSGTHRTGDARATALLERAAEAGESVAYSGVQRVRGPARVATVDVAHFPGRGLLVRVREAGQVPVFERQADREGGPQPLAAVALLERTYDAVVVRDVVVLGRVADLVEVRRRDGGVAARLWLDRGSGLTLRRDVLDGSGGVVRTSRFVELTIAQSPHGHHREGAAISGPVTSGPPSPRAAPSLPAFSLPESSRPLRTAYSPRWSAPLAPAAIAGLRRKGWPIPGALPNGLVLASARRSVRASPIALHLHYTDGLATVSVFTQRGRLATSGLRSWPVREVGGRRVHVRDGVPQQLVWPGRGVVYTMVADAPPATVAAAVAALPPARVPHGGPLGRLGRGLDRLGSWLNPLR